MKPSDFGVAFVTVQEKDSGNSLAERLTKGLVQNKLAACVTRVPGAVSHYFWEGALEEDREILLMIKTRLALFPSVSRYIRENHPAKVPEIIALPLAAGDAPYLDWLGANTRFVKPVESDKLPF